MNITTTNNLHTITDALNKADIKIYSFDGKPFYDNNIFQIYYDDFVNGVDGYHVQRLSDYYIVIYADNVKPRDKHFSKDYLLSLSDDDLQSLYDSLGFYYYDLDTKDDLIEELLDLDHEDYYEKHCKGVYYYQLDCDYIVTGYHQGDAVKVKFVGFDDEKDYPYSYQELENLFYNSPITCRIVVSCNGEDIDEIYIDELLSDMYNWDLDNVLEKVANAHKDEQYLPALLDYLKQFNEPEYFY